MRRVLAAIVLSAFIAGCATPHAVPAAPDYYSCDSTTRAQTLSERCVQ